MLKSTEIYQKNIVALQDKLPEFFAWWQNQTNHSLIELVYTLSGLPDLHVETEAGKKQALYNHDDPIQLTRQDLGDREFLKESVTFIFGLGLGYKVQQILERMENGHLLFVVEVYPQIIQLAFSFHDFSEAIREGKVAFCIPQEEVIRQIIDQQSTRLLDGKISLEMEGFAPKISSLYPVLYKSCQRLCNTLFLSYNTFIALSDVFMINELKNLPKAVLGYSTEGFWPGSSCGEGDFSRHRSFLHIPAILVATGPSLQKNIHLLREAKGKAIIIAVGQALRVLLAYDIIPDIMCSIDFGEANYIDVEDVIQDAAIPLVIDSRVYPRIPLEYQGDLVIPVYSEDILSPAKSNHQERVNRCKTVAQMGLNLALAMGADPIIFTGQDLALSDKSHISGANADTHVELQGNKIIEWNSRGRMVNEAYWVDGIYGGKVLTTKVLMGYLEDFENTVKNFPDHRFIDATEGGARIKGTEVMSLQEALDQYCRHTHGIDRLFKQAMTPLDPDLEIVTSDLESVALMVHKILRINKKLEKPLKIMKNLVPVDEKETFSESCRKRFEDLSQNINCGFKQISRAINSHRIIRSSLGKVRHALMQKKNKYEENDSFYKKAMITLNRYEVAHKGFEAIVGQVKDALNETLSHLKEYRRLKSQESGGEREGEKRSNAPVAADFHFRMGMCLKKMGYLKRAIPEFEQAIRSGVKAEESLRHLAQVYLTLEQFDQAEKCLRDCCGLRVAGCGLKALPTPNPQPATGNSQPPTPNSQPATRNRECGSPLDLPDPYNPHDEEKIQNKIRASKKKCLEKYLTKARAQSQEGDFVNTIIYSRKVLAIDPESNEARELLEKSLEQRQQRIASTQEEVRQGKEEEKRKQELARHLAEAKKLVQDNDFAKAIQVYQEILQGAAVAADHQGHPGAHFGLSRAYQGQQNWEAALKELQWLAERYPHRAQVHADLGDIYLLISKARCQESSSTGADGAASSMIADAFQAYKKAIEADKNFVHLYLKMATICTQLGKFDEAILHYEEYLNLNPGDYHSLVKLGDCYLLMGARDAAKIGYQAALRIQPNYSPAMERINRLSL